MMAGFEHDYFAGADEPVEFELSELVLLASLVLLSPDGVPALFALSDVVLLDVSPEAPDSDLPLDAPLPPFSARRSVT